MVNKQELPLGIPEDIKKKLGQIKKKLDSFKSKILKKYKKEIIGVSLLPPERPKEGEKPNLDKIDVFVLVDDDDEKKKYELIKKISDEANKISKEVDKNMRADVMLMSELRQSCYDSKHDVIQTIAASTIVHDPKDILKAVKIAEVHKNMVIKKFDRYIVSYVAVGSLFRGDATSGDIDVAVIVDDTDVKKMSRYELRDKLGAIIRSMGFQAESITGVKKAFHIQVYILTDFWESVKDAHPVIFTFLRDGVPLYDRGVFMPWKLLLEMGRIKPSPESIDMHMDVGYRLLDRVKGKLFSIVSEDIYYAMLNPAQAALMMYGLAPPTPKETIELMDEIFVKREKLLEKKYVDMLENVRKLFKDIEHGKIKEVSGKEIDKMTKDTKDYLDRLEKMFVEIQKKKGGESFVFVYDNCVGSARDALKLVGGGDFKDSELVNKFKEGLVDTGLVPNRFLKVLRSVMKSKPDYDKGKLGKAEVEKVRKEVSGFVKGMVEFMQKKRGRELERAKIQFKYGDKFGEVFLLDDIAYIIDDIDAGAKKISKAKIGSDGGLERLEKSSFEEMEKSLKSFTLTDRVFIKEKIFEDLKRIFGSDIQILVSW